MTPASAPWGPGSSQSVRPLQLGRDGIQFLIDVNQHDAYAFGYESLCHGSASPNRGARDDAKPSTIVLPIVQTRPSS